MAAHNIHCTPSTSQCASESRHSVQLLGHQRHAFSLQATHKQQHKCPVSCLAAAHLVELECAAHTASQNISRRQHVLQLSRLAGLGITAAVLTPGAGAAAAADCPLQTSSSGLRWCDLMVGQGAAPIKGAFTKIHYTAKLASNGFAFDSSYQRKSPLIIKVGEREVIEAFDVAVLGAQDIPAMKEGGKRLVVAPPGPLQRQGTKSLVWMVGMLDALEEAGELSADGVPTSDLVFELELVPRRRSK